MPSPARLVTAEEFARIPNDAYHYELVDGRVVPMSPPGSRHGALATRIAMLLQQCADTQRLGTVITAGGFTIGTDPDTVREPDVAFISRERVLETGIPDSFWPGPPDLAVEIVSPSDRRLAVTAKANDYLARGVRLVWVVDSKKATVTVYRPAARPVALGSDEILDARDVLPGFSCAVARLFE